VAKLLLQWLCSEPERKDKQGTLKLHAQSSTLDISSKGAVISNLRTAFDSQLNYLQNGFL
jgi:hypothetical protein